MNGEHQPSDPQGSAVVTRGVVTTGEGAGSDIAPAGLFSADRAPVPQAPLTDAETFGARLRDYLRIAIRRKFVIASGMLVVVTLGMVSALMTTPLYSSTVRLQIDRNVAKVVESGNITPVEGSDLEFLRTQDELLLSRAMAERVASLLKLGDDATFVRPQGRSWIAAIRSVVFSEPRPAANEPEFSRLEKSAIGLILNNRTVHPVAGARLVDVTITDPNPGRAQRIAKAYGEAFIASNLDKRLEANVYAKTFLEDQVKQLKLRLGESEKLLLDFAQKQQIVVVNEKSSIAAENLSAANATLGNLVADRMKSEQLWRQADRADAINLPQLLTNSVIDGLRGKRNELTTQYQEKTQTFKPGYPVMIQIQNKITEIDHQLASEVQTIKESLKAGFDSAKQQEEEMLNRIATLKGEVLDLQQRSIEYNLLKREVDTNRSLYEGLLQRYKEVDVAGGAGMNNVFVVDRAQIPDSPSSPQLLRTLLVSLCLGLILGMGSALLLERIDDSLQTIDDVERQTGLVTLGMIPKVPTRLSVDDAIRDPQSVISEGYRSFCTALQFSTDQGLPKTLLFTSSRPAEGKSTSAVAVARHFARMGLKVLLVDADMRNGGLHHQLELQNDVGLSSYLTGACTPPEAFQKDEAGGFAFLSAGPTPPNAADLLASPRLLSLLTVGLDVFDFIVLDGPPVLGLADVVLLSNATAATVFVVGAGEARLGAARMALKRLRLSRGQVIGALMTKLDKRHTGYGYDYHYAYGYGYGTGSKAAGAAAAASGLLSRLRGQSSIAPFDGSVS